MMSPRFTRPMIKRSAQLLVLAVFALRVHAQAPGPPVFAPVVAPVVGPAVVPAAAAERVLVLSTNAPEALVFVDSVLVGRASEQPFVIPSAARRVHLTAPTLGSWSITPVTAELVPGDTRQETTDTVRVNLPFDYTYSINSKPFGAIVTAVAPDGQVVRGQTPFAFTVDRPLESNVLLSHDGYKEYSWAPSGLLWNRHVAALEPLPERPVVAVVQRRRPRRRWIDVVSIGVAGGAAAAAIHYKFKADRRYEVYTQTGDPTLRPAIKQLDVRSGVALGVMQVGLGVFAVRMILD